jgi:hypothetical protein
MIIKKTILNQKPIESDIHYKYRCPSSDCNTVHWLSEKEVKTKNFKVVCDCGTVFKPKRIRKTKTCFYKHKSTKINNNKEVIDNTNNQRTEPVINNQVPDKILSEASSILSIYGFTNDESKEMIIRSYNDHPENNIALLVKQTLQKLEMKDG